MDRKCPQWEQLNTFWSWSNMTMTNSEQDGDGVAVGEVWDFWVLSFHQETILSTLFQRLKNHSILLWRISMVKTFHRLFWTILNHKYASI